MSRNTEFSQGLASAQVPDGAVECDSCGQEHPAYYSHDSQWGDHKPVYAVHCPEEGVTDYYTAERFTGGEAFL